MARIAKRLYALDSDGQGSGSSEASVRTIELHRARHMPPGLELSDIDNEEHLCGRRWRRFRSVSGGWQRRG